MIVIDIIGNDDVEIDTKKVNEEAALKKRQSLEQLYREEELYRAPQLQLVIELMAEILQRHAR